MTTEHVTRTPPETTTTVDEAVRDALAVRQAKALLDLRSMARVFDELPDESRRDAQDALHQRIDLALGNGATMLQIAQVLADGARIDQAHRQQVRRITGQVPGGSPGFVTHDATLDELLDRLETSVESSREVCDRYELDRQTLHTMQRDVAGMRRLFNLPLPEGS